MSWLDEKNEKLSFCQKELEGAEVAGAEKLPSEEGLLEMALGITAVSPQQGHIHVKHEFLALQKLCMRSE